ncbi:MAG: MATE family efflux transporter [Clostridia bacterium]|nr:MATE family efflux transporter [Clostridia bacterium]
MTTRKNAVYRLTEGPIAKQILFFALPFLGSSLIQQLYNTVDLIFVGKLLGTEASAAVGAGSLIITCLLGFFTGISIGVGVVAGKAFGARDKKRLHALIHSAAGLALAGTVVLTVIGVAFAPIFLRWLRVPEEILPQAIVYMRIYFAGILSIIGYNVSSGILRALGDSRSPMLYQLMGGIANVAANALFLSVFRMGVEGVALATFFSQGTAAILSIRHICRLDPAYRLRFKDIRIDRSCCVQILNIGIPAAVQAMVITLSNLVVQANINSLGVASIAAFTAYFKVENFIYLPIMAIDQANANFAAQNFGAKRSDRVITGVRVSLLAGISLAIMLSGTVLLFSKGFFSMFLNEAATIDLGVLIARTTFPFYFLYVMLEVVSGTIRGYGKAIPPMLIIVGNMCGVRLIALRILMVRFHSAEGIAWVYPITWLTASICLAVCYLYERRCFVESEPASEC